jgi:ABC-type transport system involved in cytochrome bd biosynthesis fused ATPase/permease subunit
MANLVRAFFVALNVFATTCHGQSLASYPGIMTLYGGPIVYLLVQSLVLFCILVWWDNGFLVGRLRQKHRSSDVEDEATTNEKEVLDELTRVSSSNDGLRVLHLSKTFKRNVAVDDLTFGVKRGEVFALLGSNGAGKSTTISLIRGDIRPNKKGGEIYVENISVSTHRASARSHLGVCPQFDAVSGAHIIQ